MIKIDKDKNPKLSTTYGFDGEYVPRTIALYPNGSVMHEIYPLKQYRYYIQPTASDLLSLMEKVRSNM